MISWETANQVASRVARRHRPFTDYERRSLEDDFVEMTARAEELVHCVSILFLDPALDLRRSFACE